MPLTAAGDLLTLAIEKPAAGGRMIARADRLVVLVSGAIPGERVQARVERIGKGVAYAVTEHVEEPSPDRRPVEGDPLCGGCLYAHVAYERQLQIKSLVIADAFARVGHLELPAPVHVRSSPETGYRLRARLHVRGRAAGFFREGTHDLCDARQTRQLLPDTSVVLDRLLEEAASLGVTGIREIELAENVGASERVAHLESLPLDASVLDRLAATDGLTGLSTEQAARGTIHLRDTLTLGAHPSFALRHHVLAFFQGNRYLLHDLVAHVAAQVPEGASLTDLYAGVGLFAVAAAVARGARVTAVEGDRIAAGDLVVNAADAGGSVAAVHQSVEAYVATRSARAQRTGTSVVTVDPPRTGMSREALDGVIAMRPARLVYVSCDVATLARDARRLHDARYRLTTVDAFDLFPNTPHVETVAIFDR